MTAPFVSVIVPTADRPDQLRSCVAALAALDHPRERIEVIVVDDAGSADLTGAVRSEPRVRVIRRRERGGPAAARNTGAAAADGELLAFTDDDCRPDPGWLRALTAELAASPGAAVGGCTKNALAANPYAGASQHIQDLVYAHYNRDPAAASFVASNNVALPRTDFLDIGGFDAGRFPFASEDRDLCDRWLASGRTLRYAPGALVWHAHDLDLPGFARQHLAYGRGAARFHAARATRGTGRLRDTATFHRDPSLWRESLRHPRTVPLLAVWQIANAAGYALERWRIGSFVLAAPAGAETVSAVGSSQVRVEPENSRDNESIKTAIAQARALSLPLALADARTRAHQLADGTGLVLGNIESVEEYQDARFGYDAGLSGTFGPGEFCGTVTRSVRRRLRDGRLVRRRVKQTRCFFPRTLLTSVEVTYQAARG